MPDLRQVEPCAVKWRPGMNYRHTTVGGWHTCTYPDASHSGRHECDCGDWYIGPPTPDGPLLPYPGREEPARKTTAEATLGLVALIAGLELLQLAVLVGILTAVLT